jgi:2'-hydroxyisoflavone reductase
MSNRRDFIRTAAGGAFGLAVAPQLPSTDGGLVSPATSPLLGQQRARRPLKILILGGTSFIGPYQVQYALDRGHSVTLFNRGRTNPQLFPKVEKLVGDRAVANLASLKGKTWDAVIDNSATNPDWVRDAAQLLKDQARTYLFISTRSVYSDTSRVPMTTDAPVFTRENTQVEQGRPLPYGLAKAEAEKEARKAFGNRALIMRPGLIIGPGDDTDRFSYWPIRIDKGGEVLAPGDGNDFIQIVDARDLAEWCIRMLEQEDSGTYNVVGPKKPRTMEEMLFGIRAVTDPNVDVSFTWVDADFLIANRVRPYAEMPVWRPSRGESAGFARFDITPEVSKGLTFRPLAVTVNDLLEWHRARPAERQAVLRAGLTPEREKEVLQLWKQRRS